MRIVVNHLTRMRAPRICVAGFEPDSPGHVRPTSCRDRPLTREHLAESGGVFELGAIVELGPVRPTPSPPETEDHLFSPERAQVIGRLEPDDYLAEIDARCDRDLENVFGPALQRREWKYAIDEGEGERSLGCLHLRRRPDIEVDRFGKPQLRLNEQTKPAYLSVTDIRLVEPDHTTVRAAAVEDVRRRMRRGVGVRLMLGVARPFQARGDNRLRHWLQVNGICLDDRPLGELP